MLSYMELVFLLLFIGQGSGIDLNRFGSTEVTPVFTFLESYGDFMLKIHNDKLKKFMDSKGRPFFPADQVMSVLIATEGEILDPGTWNIKITKVSDKPISFKVREVKTFINKRNDNFPYGTGQQAVHGEVQSIYYQNLGLEQMIQMFKHEQPSHYPLVVMFSHYIPCANVRNLGYSCSEELANFARINAGTLGVMVGYRAIFPGTNAGLSVDFMRNGGIKLFRKNNNLYESSYNVNNIGTPAVYQTLFYECLIKNTVSDCCTKDTNAVDKTKEEERKSSIVAYFVNSVMRICTNRLSAGYPIKGYLTQLARDRLGTYIQEFLSQNIGSNCPACTVKRTNERQILTCALQSLFLTGQVLGVRMGEQEIPVNPYIPRWKPTNLNWNQIYATSPSTPVPAVQCTIPGLLTSSLCTKGNLVSSVTGQAGNVQQKTVAGNVQQKTLQNQGQLAGKSYAQILMKSKNSGP